MTMHAGEATTTPSASDDGSDETLFSRREEAERVAAFILAAKGRFVVLSGPRASGKTLLITHWLIPTLVSKLGQRVMYGACSQRFPSIVSGTDGETSFDEALQRGSIIFADEFDRVLEAPKDERRAELDRFFERLRRTDAAAKVVAIVQAGHLTSVFALSSYDPDIVSGVCELRSVEVGEGLKQLSAGQPGRGTVYTPAVLEALTNDLEALKQRGLDASFDLMRLIDERLGAEDVANGASPVDMAEYVRVGRVTGMLRIHLEQRLEGLETEQSGAEQTARALLQRILEAHTRSGAPDLDDIAPRLGVTRDEVDRVFMRLFDPSPLLLRKADGRIEFRPAHLRIVVEEDVAARKLQNQRVRRILDEGLKSCQLLGTCLPSARFAEVHRRRRHLDVDEEEIRFLLQSALRSAGDLTGAAEYWLGRLSSRQDGMDLLLAAAFDASPEVRAKAVALLAGFPEPVVRERLKVIALTDGAPDVRERAVESLRAMATPQLLGTLLQELRDPRSAYRGQAMDALRIFPQPDVAAALESIVKASATDLELRKKAISVLAVLGIEPSTDALIAIALSDPDDDDREAAAQSLAQTTNEALNTRILERLEIPRLRTRLVVVGLAMAFVAAWGLVPFLLLIGVVASVWAFSLGGIAAVALVFGSLCVVTSSLLLKVRDGRLRRRSPLGILGIALYVLCTLTVLPWLHGVAHAMAGKVRRALALLGLEALGFVSVYLITDMMEFVPRLWWLAVVYRWAGWALIIGTYLYDVLWVAIDVFVLPRHRRRVRLFRTLFHNPAMVDVVFGWLRAPDPHHRSRARRLIRWFGREIPSTKLADMLEGADPVAEPLIVRALKRSKDDGAVSRLEHQWPQATSGNRRAIEAVLLGRPTPRSLRAYDRIAAQSGPLARVRAAFARIHYRFAVWSMPVRVAAGALIPFVAVSLYHGAMIAKDHTWTQVMLLRHRLPSTEQKVKIVRFLVDAYPREAAADLHELFRDRRAAGVDSVQAALVRGLVSLSDSGFIAPRDSLGPELAAEAVRFDSLLHQPDSGNFVMGLEVLRAMANASDTVLANHAVRFLSAYVSAPTDSVHTIDRNRRAIAALGDLQSARSLAVLDTLLQSRLTNKVLSSTRRSVETEEDLREQLGLVYARSVVSATVGSAAARARLLRTLQRLKYRQEDVISTLAARVREDSSTQRDCNRAPDGTCDEIDHALAFIASSPDVEDGYRDLFAHFVERASVGSTGGASTARPAPVRHEALPVPAAARVTVPPRAAPEGSRREDGKAVPSPPVAEAGGAGGGGRGGGGGGGASSNYRQAAAEFARLRDQFPDRIWPRKILAEIYHEQLSRSDAGAFVRSYDEMSQLRQLPAYRRMQFEAPSDAARIEADFAEIALTARRFDESEATARDLLASADPDEARRMNMSLFLYVSRVMQHQPDSAVARLADFERLVLKLPQPFYNNWVYPGSLAFITGSDLPSPLKAALRRLCREGAWYSKAEARDVIAANRAALAMLRSR
ncbi:MAG: HEAT repeat domain-containing protein [Gemmatimonadaceae bacterium]